MPSERQKALTRDREARGALAADPVYLIKQRRTSSRQHQHQQDTARLAADRPLSRVELEVLRLVAEGCPNAEIATLLVKGEETVKTQIRRLLAHLQARDRTHAVAIALRRGLID